MKTLINQTHPYMRIFNPATGDYAQFAGGRLDIEEGDPNFEVVMAEAIRNPSVSIIEEAKGHAFCPECSAGPFTGQTGKARLSKHRQDVHFDEWAADQTAERAAEMNVLLKERAGIACDICQPVQVFPDQASLVQHIRLLHTSPSDDAAEAVTARRPGEVEPVSEEPATKLKKG